MSCPRIRTDGPLVKEIVTAFQSGKLSQYVLVQSFFGDDTARKSKHELIGSPVGDIDVRIDDGAGTRLIIRSFGRSPSPRSVKRHRVSVGVVGYWHGLVSSLR
jgi:hypothetical protein